MTDVTLGDLASTMALAPGEKVTFEFQSSQRKVLEQSTMDSTESLSSIESTTADKEAINIARSSTETQGWHVDSTATLTCGYGSLSVSAGYNKSVTDSNSQAISHIHDTTVHSAKSLKALHKIEVKGVTESTVSNRMTRTIENPYFDRCVSINVFHLLKKFSVQTALSEMRYAIVLSIDDLAFNNDFVLNNGDFLRSYLLDSSLLDDLQVAVQGAKPALTQTATQAAKETAQRALAYLYDYSPSVPRPTAHDLFHLPDLNNVMGRPPVPQTVVNAFTENLMAGQLQGTAATNFQNSGFGKSNDQHCIQLFTILGFFYGVIQEDVDNPDPATPPGSPKVNILGVGQNAVNIAVALATGVGAVYKDVFTDPLKSAELINVMKEDALTEVIRRVPGFLTIVSGILQPLLDPLKVEQAALADYAQAQFVLQRLLTHLECNRHYYVQRYLRYVSKVTANQAIVDFATDALKVLVDTPGVLPQDANKNPVVAIGDFDLDRTFIDKTEVVIPGIVALGNDVVTTLVQTVLGDKDLLPVVDPGPLVVNDLEVAADGIHMEVVEGACPPLKNVPAPQPGASITVNDLQASINN
ncbi:hypothetical protein PPGU19_063570 (plasmid) [Paraburkholderia sp. PGU19]|nr:hypothetical protein PPGU19_063570 [Paraburkholderia sp. PGU19]